MHNLWIVCLLIVSVIKQYIEVSYHHESIKLCGNWFLLVYWETPVMNFDMCVRRI